MVDPKVKGKKIKFPENSREWNIPHFHDFGVGKYILKKDTKILILTERADEFYCSQIKDILDGLEKN